MSSTQTFSNQIYRDGSSLYPFNNVTFNSVTIPPQSSLSTYIESSLLLNFTGAITFNNAPFVITRVGRLCTLSSTAIISGAFINSILQSPVASIPSIFTPSLSSNFVFVAVNNNISVPCQLTVSSNGAILLGTLGSGSPAPFQVGAINNIPPFSVTWTAV